MKWKASITALLLVLLAAVCIGCAPKKEAAGKPASDPALNPPPVEQNAEPATEPEPVSEPDQTDEPGEVPEEIDGLQLYGGTLDRFYALIRDGFQGNEPGEGVIGVIEMLSGTETEEALDTTGYAILDISGDGVPELLIGAISDETDANSPGSVIYAGFSCPEGTPVCFLEGWARNSYQWLGDGAFFYLGSGGAAYSAFGTETIAPDGASLVCSDFYFTYEKGENYGDIGYYHNTTGAWDPDTSEEIETSNDAFWQLEEDLRANVRTIELTPFSAYPLAKLPVRAEWAEETAGAVVPEGVSDPVWVRFSARSPVADFRLVELTELDIDENGKLTFRPKVCTARAQLLPGETLTAGLAFPGDTPHYGVMFTDADGFVRLFAVDISGRDGSLILWEP